MKFINPVIKIELKKISETLIEFKNILYKILMIKMRNIFNLFVSFFCEIYN